MVVQVVLGTAELKLSQLRRLQVGDVLMLDESHAESAMSKQDRSGGTGGAGADDERVWQEMSYTKSPEEKKLAKHQ